MLVLHISDALKDSPPNGIANVLGSSLGVDIAEIDRPVHLLSGGGGSSYSEGRARWRIEALCREPSAHGSERHRREVGVDGGELALLLLRLGNVRAAVLAVVDALARPLRFSWERSDDLSNMVSGHTEYTSWKSYLGGDRDAQEVNEANVFVPDNLDLIDEAEARETVPKLLLGHRLVEPAEIDVPAGVALRHAKQNSSGNRARLAPSDLELLPVKRELLNVGICVEGGRGGTVEERDEDAGLFGENTDGLERTEMDEVKKLIDGRVGWEISNVDGAAGGIVSGTCGCHGRSGDGGVVELGIEHAEVAVVRLFKARLATNHAVAHIYTYLLE